MMVAHTIRRARKKEYARRHRRMMKREFRRIKRLFDLDRIRRILNRGKTSEEVGFDSFVPLDNPYVQILLGLYGSGRKSWRALQSELGISPMKGRCLNLEELGFVKRLDERGDEYALSDKGKVVAKYLREYPKWDLYIRLG